MYAIGTRNRNDPAANLLLRIECCCQEDADEKERRSLWGKALYVSCCGRTVLYLI